MLIFCCCDNTPGQAKPIRNTFRVPFLLKRYLLHHYPTVSANLLTRVVCKITAIFRAGEKKKNKKTELWFVMSAFPCQQRGLKVRTMLWCFC